MTWKTWIRADEYCLLVVILRVHAMSPIIVRNLDPVPRILSHAVHD